jgi:hypothetical protein
MDILVLIVVALIFFYAGWQSREAYAMHVVRRILEEAEEMQEPEEEPRQKMVLEKHNDVIYAYTDDNHEFMAQGKDLFELDTAIQARYPGKKFAIREDNLKEIAVEYHESV